jgi:hypothetical protein
MRVDPATQFGGIRVNSFTSTLVFLGAIAYILLAPKGREDPATLGGTPAQTEEASSAGGEAAAQEPADSTDVADAGEEDVTKAPVDDPAEESADETGENSGIVEK